jgi:hypothetical protein
MQYTTATASTSCKPCSSTCTSCNPTNPTVVGTWEVVAATVSYNNGTAGGYDSEAEIGQIWTLDAAGKMTVEGNASDYELIDSKLITSYAEMYQANYFVVEELTLETMTLSASYVKKDKVSEQLITYTFKFKRLAE